MEEKCFCHLNGYKVKDADARIEIENLKNDLNNIEKEYEYFELPFSKLGVTGAYQLKSMNNLATVDTELCGNLTPIIQRMFKGEDGTYSRTNYINRKPLIVYFRNDISSNTFLTEEVSLYHLSNANNNTSFIDFESNYTFVGSSKEIANRGFKVTVDTNFNVTKIEIIKNKLNILTTDNTSSYTPSGSYHPATKKYVDDAIANVESSGGTGGVSEDTVNTLISNAISEEVGNRNTAINTAISEIEVGLNQNQVNSLITSAINQEVTNRNNADTNTLNSAKEYVDTKLSNNRSILKATIGSDIKISSSARIKIPLNETIKIGNKFSVNTNGDIVVGSGVNHILVSGNVYFKGECNNGDSLRAHIYKNEEQVAKNWERYCTSSGSSNDGAYEDRSIVSTLISVVPGDVISLRGANATSGKGSIGEFSYLSVEYMD